MSSNQNKSSSSGNDSSNSNSDSTVTEYQSKTAKSESKNDTMDQLNSQNSKNEDWKEENKEIDISQQHHMDVSGDPINNAQIEESKTGENEQENSDLIDSDSK